MKTNVQKLEDYTQVCVWPGTIVDDNQIQDFEAFFLDELGTRVQYLESILTFPDKDLNYEDIEGTGGRSDVFFAVHQEDVAKFSLPRFEFGIRWVEDVIGNMDMNKEALIYPERVRAYQSWDYMPGGPECGNDYADENEEDYK